MNHTPSKREHLRHLVESKQSWSQPLSADEQAKGFLGWHERGFLPHCDRPGLIQFVTFRLADSLPANRRGEWEHLLSTFSPSDARCSIISPPSNARRSKGQAAAQREQQLRFEEYLDRGLGECHLRDARIASFFEKAILYHHTRRFRIRAWVVMPNHVHVLVEVWQTPLSRVLQNWKSISGIEANRILQREGVFWQPEYWDRFMRDEAEIRRSIHYIESNPVRAKLCRSPTDWPFSSARFRDQRTGELRLPVS